MNHKIILRSAVFFALAAIACAVVLPLAVTPLINTEPVKSKLTGFIQNRTGFKVGFNQLSFVFDPLPGICMTDIYARIDQGRLVKIDQAVVELDPVKLLEFKPTIRRITLQTPELITKQATAGTPAPTAPFNISSSLQKGFDQLLALVPADTDHLDIIVINARSDYFNTMNCRMLMTGRTQTVDIKAQVSNFKLEPHRIPKLESALKGRITRIDIPYMSVALRHDKNTFLAGGLDITSLCAFCKAPGNQCIQARDFDIDFALSQDGVTAHLAPLTLVYPRGRVGIDLSFSFGTKPSHIDFTGEQIDISQARQVCLPLLKGLRTSAALFDILRAGVAKKIRVGFKANEMDHLFNVNNLFIDGCAESATVKIPEVPVIAENVSGCAKMKDGVLSIYPEQGHVGKTVISGGDLDLDMAHPHTVPFSGKFPLNIDLSDLPSTLIALLPETSLAREMSKISGLAGRADAVLELNHKEVHDDLDVRVDARIIQANGNYGRLPLPIRIDSGGLVVDNRKVVLKNMAGSVADSRISNLNADINTRGSLPMNIKNMAATIILEQASGLVDLFPGARKKLGPVTKLSGTMGIELLNIHGPMLRPDQWKYHMKGKVNKGAVTFSDKSKAVCDLFCRFNAAPSQITLSDTACTINNLAWLERNILPSYTQSIVLPLTLSQGQFVNKPGTCMFQGQLRSTSGAQVSFKTDGPAMDKMTPSHVKITDGGQTKAQATFYKNEDMPVLDFSGQLDTTTLEKMLYPDSCLHRKLSEITGENALTVATDNTGNITITADNLNLDPLLSQKRTPDNASLSRPLVKQKQIVFNVNTLGYEERVYHGVQATVTFNRTATDIDIAHAMLCGLDLSGRVIVNHSPKSPGVSTRLLFNTDQATEVSLSLGCLTGTQSVIKGSYTLKGEISGSAPTLDLVKSGQEGHLDFKARAGRIFKATLLSRLLSVVNILGDTDLSQQGFGFKTFTADADVKHSVIHIKKAFIDADNMAIMAQGWVDPLNDALDITVLLSPFKTIDTIIKYIPVVNTILNGQLVTVPARAYGKISDPTVVPLAPSAVGKGLLNLLNNLVRTPGRLIDGVKDNEKSP